MISPVLALLPWPEFLRKRDGSVYTTEDGCPITAASRTCDQCALAVEEAWGYDGGDGVPDAHAHAFAPLAAVVVRTRPAAAGPGEDGARYRWDEAHYCWSHGAMFLGERRMLALAPKPTDRDGIPATPRWGLHESPASDPPLWRT